MNVLCLVCDRVAYYIVNGNSVCGDEKCLDTAAVTNGQRIIRHKKYLRSLREES